jgi:polysaccharide export outer membrane protein
MIQLFSLILMLSAVQATGPQPQLQERHPRYRLQSGDVFELTFPFTPEFNQTLTVQPDGYINLRAAGDLYIQGKTTPELIEAVREAYAGILREPVITADLRDFEKPYFSRASRQIRPARRHHDRSGRRDRRRLQAAFENVTGRHIPASLE